MSTHESALLKPRDPSITNSDDWPIFILKNASIFDPLDPAAEPCNLLHAGAYRPLSITGKLESLPSETSHLLLKPSYHRSQPIEITDVRQFSYGQYEDKSVDIWAAGQAGWFTINPSRAYKDTYADMVDAVTLLYFAADAYKEVKRASDMDAQDLFRKYCLEHQDSCPALEDAESLFTRHRYFLFASMLDGKEGLQWSRIPLFKYLESTFPDDATLIRQRRAFAMKPPKAHSSKRSTQSPAPSSSSLKRKRKDRMGTPASVTATRRSHSRSVSVATATPSMMSLASEPRNRDSRTTRGSTKPLSPHFADPVKGVGNESDADSEESIDHRRGRKGKSSLRPKPSKYVHGRDPLQQRGDGNAADDADDDETDEPHGAIETSPSSKRKMVNDLRSRRAKRRNSEKPQASADLDDMIITGAEVIGGAEAGDMKEEDSSVATPTEAYHDAKEAFTNIKQPILPFRFRDARLGEDEGDVWRCSTDGCMHRVYAASEPASQILIEDHERIHGYDEDTRVQLVRRMEAPWLPVGRLMGRVRELAAQSGVPAPVVQRY